MKTCNKLFIVADDPTHVSIDTAAFNDQSLSYKAMGIHAFIRTRPHGTLTSMPDLVRGSNDGEHAIRSGIKELVKSKYLYLVQLRDNQGKMAGVVYVSFPKPTKIRNRKITELVKNITDSPHRENHHTATRERRKTTAQNTEKTTEKSTEHRFPTRARARVKDLKYNYILDHNLTNYNSPYGELNYLNYDSESADAEFALKSKKRENKEIQKAEKLFEFWNSLPNTPTHRSNRSTKIYKTSILSLCKAVRRFSMREIQSAMEAYDQLLGTPATVMRSSEAPFRVGLDQFFRFQNYANSLRRKDGHPLCEMKNWFTECRSGYEYLVAKYTKAKKDKNPRITKLLTAAVVGSPLFGISREGDLGTPQKNTLICASAKMREFVDKHEKLLLKAQYLARKSPESICVEKLIGYLKSIGGRLHLGYLVSDITWGNLRYYMTEMGAIAPKPQESGFRSIRDAARS